ncbi:TdeIII family type II restriction endonuclease [Patescibacteria group bacterium]|nr:TdeIII family type II restriction endonuclease [Patescibacteria group bacterium]
MAKNSLPKSEAIKSLVYTAVESYAEGFQARHEGEKDDPDGTINMKIHNVFIAALGPEIQFFTALVRSLDSSLGNMLEKLAINIANFSYEVKKRVEGPLGVEQTRGIAELLEKYKRREIAPPTVEDYQFLRTKPTDQSLQTKRHESDYYLIDKETKKHFLIELKIGGDLDNKKARSEKEALLEQFAILSNTLPGNTDLKLCFATAYNRYGEDKPWKQERVRQFFADDELLIGKDFWNFVCKGEDGYDTVLGAYKEKAHLIKEAVDTIKKKYLE